MLITLHMFDPETGKNQSRTQVFDYPGKEDPKTLNPIVLWGTLGQNTSIEGTVWQPPAEESIFDGSGWRDELTARDIVSLIANGSVGPKYAVAHKLEKEVIEKFDSHIQRLLLRIEDVSKYSAFEKSTWPQQQAEAKELMDDEDAPALMLRQLARAENRDVQELALIILAKAEEEAKATQERLIYLNGIRSRKAKALNLEDRVEGISEMNKIVQELYQLAE